MKIKIRKISGILLHVKLFFLLNSTNVALLLSTFSDGLAKMWNWNTAGPVENIDIIHNYFTNYITTSNKFILDKVVNIYDSKAK